MENNQYSLLLKKQFPVSHISYTDHVLKLGRKFSHAEKVTTNLFLNNELFFKPVSI